MNILVCPLSQVGALVAERRPGRVVTLLDPDTPAPDLGPYYKGRHLKLVFHDVHEAAPGVIVASRSHLASLVAFVEEWNPTAPLLIHCRAGIGRSTAAAFVAACHRNPDVPEIDIARELRRASPLARPNETVVRIADQMLGRRGRMSAAITETGHDLPWVDAIESVPFTMPAKFEVSGPST